MSVDFQPMPKRFMVWDDKTHNFVKGVNGYILNWREVANLVEPTIWDCATELDEVVERFTIIQSTNLFDKDGNEVFEGSIVRKEWGNTTSSCCMDFEVYGVVKNVYGNWCIVEDDELHSDFLGTASPEQLTLCGHILSNLELLEKE